jgi:hypothetical protein
MELKLSVNIGASLQVKNAKGEWDWIKPEVGAEISLNRDDLNSQLLLPQEELVTEEEFLQTVFGKLWDNVVGPQFRNVVNELIAEPVAIEESTEEVVEGETTEEVVVTDEYEY